MSLATLEESSALYDSITTARGGVSPAAGFNPLPNLVPGLMGPYDMSQLSEHERLWQDTLRDREAKETARRALPVVQLYDGDYNLRGAVAGERGGDFEFVENETGTASIQLPLNHYLARWVMNFQGRAKRNVHITIDKQGARWNGFMDHYRVVREKGGDAYLDVVFKHDFEQCKHVVCWASPFLRPELQFPKLWVIFGPAKWCLLMTFFVNILRLETSLWTLPDNPLDITEWMGPSFDPSFWRNIVKPFGIVSDNSNTTIVFARFKPWFDVAKPILADAQLTVTCRRYLPTQGDPHPFAATAGLLGLDSDQVANLATLIPLRNGCLVWDIVDNSGWGTETAFGGSLLTGLIRAAVSIGGNGFTEGVDVFTGDPTYPGEYYNPLFLGTSPQAPWVVYDCQGMFNGVESSEFIYYEAQDTSFLTGGQSMPGVNEGISAGINLGGDFLTSFINSQIAAASAASVGGGFGVDASISVPPIDLPPLGGVMDAVAKILYENVFLAFMEIPTLRAAGMSLPIPGLESLNSSLGDFHLYEKWCDGADRAFTLSAGMAIRAGQWATRLHFSHKISVSDAAPYIFGESPYGHFFIGSRIATTVPEFPVPDTLFVERVGRAKYAWGKDGPTGWKLTVGYREPEDPALKALSMIREINQGLGTFGIL